MLKDANFLCEIGCEEVPAGYIPPAIEYIKKFFTEGFSENRIDFSTVEVMATPRRFSVLVSGVADIQRSEEIEIKGPAKKSAYDEKGDPTRAMEGFLKGNGIDAKDVFEKSTEKGEYLFARKKLESGRTEDMIPSLVEKLVRDIQFPKKMRWSGLALSFPRPILYFLVLFNDKQININIEGIKSSGKTRGHFIQHNRMIEVKSISEYENILMENGVILDQKKRKEIIRKGLHEYAAKTGATLHEDEDLLDTVTFLVENPFFVICDFKEEFLEIPDIVLIAEMKEHQKTFALLDKNGRLMNRFIAVSNNPPTDFIKAGNERVISARFNDARFFYTEDRKLKLSERVDTLKKVLFHKELGSIYDKVKRVEAIAEVFILKLSIDKVQADKIRRAAYLSKADLNTAMVFEFPSLQGAIGKIYAENDNEDREVAEAIENQYKPRSQSDSMPENIVSIVLSMSEKIDNIFGSYSVGNIPKGSQDPYALRRQANAIVEMLIKNSINLELKEVFEAVSSNYKDGKGLVPKIAEFTAARAKTIFTDSGFLYDEIDACLSSDSTDYLELFRRAKALNEFRKNENFSQMLLGFKRMNNITGAFRRENSGYNLKFSESLLVDEAEKKLHAFFSSRKKIISELISASNYIELFQLMIEGKVHIDLFFDKVLVMDKNLEIRDNRLYLLEDILSNFRGLIDFSKISDK